MTWPNCDWHDNFAFDDAQRVFGVIGDKVTRVNEILQNANILSPQNNNIVSIGKIITILIDNEEERGICIGWYETPIQGRVSYNAPIIKSLLWKRAWDFVEVVINWSQKEIEILDIK